MRRSYRVVGRVQGVGFRQFTAARAKELGLMGWVRNLPDGSVEAEAQGHEVTLADFEALLRRGPQLSRVDSLVVAELPEQPAMTGFEILR
ncbi:MAG TPA: acylphosphatase [Turneriella sp.]|nr:acylphosphatase [Turneriella sp.]HMY10405.1 acylphosphatase [Turneriella sp.]HNA77950.1 acylphosphatase [Turneriella sp.]HNE18573.1 acylphosphatase [Turneriella sp.]HNL11865.1 acylphosphatase [Turneriella sp.]